MESILLPKDTGPQWHPSFHSLLSQGFPRYPFFDPFLPFIIYIYLFILFYLCIYLFIYLLFFFFYLFFYITEILAKGK